MPASSEKQRKLFGTALGQQRSGEITDTPAGKIAETVPEEKIREYAKKPIAKKKKVKKSFPGPAVNPLDEPEDTKSDIVRRVAAERNIPTKDIKLKRPSPSNLKGLPVKKCPVAPGKPLQQGIRVLS